MDKFAIALTKCFICGNMVKDDKMVIIHIEQVVL